MSPLPLLSKKMADSYWLKNTAKASYIPCLTSLQAMLKLAKRSLMPRFVRLLKKQRIAWQSTIYLAFTAIRRPCFQITPIIDFAFWRMLDVDTEAQLDTDIVAAVWMTPDELEISARARSPLVLKAIQDALAGKKYPLSLVYEHPFASPLTSQLDA